jgi:multiple sugar transport system permease protein
VVALFQFMGVWNNYLGPLIYLRDRDMWPISLALRGMQGQLLSHAATPHRYTYLMAVSTVFTVPIIVLFFVAQRTFIEGIAVTGIKE